MCVNDTGSGSNVSRRRALAAVGAGLLAGVAGCSGGSGVADTDGDGVIDSEDYAPRDADVQERSDVASGGRMTTATETPMPRSTPTRTPTATPTPTPTAAPSLELTASETFEHRNYLSRYGNTSVTVQVLGEDVNGNTATGNDLAIGLSSFPRQGEHLFERTPFSASDDGYTSVSLDVDFPEDTRDTIVHYMVFFVDEDVPTEIVTSEDLTLVDESDPFVVDTETNRIRRATPEVLAGLESEEGDSYSRVDQDGSFGFTADGRTNGQQWTADYFIYKSAYAREAIRDHGRSREEFVSYEMQNGFAGELASLLSDIANANDLTDKHEQVEFVIDFVQRLPYVPDDVSTGYNDYTKFSVESLTELGGDCEDTAVMLAGVLQSEPFAYDMVLIQPPGHMAAGIYGSDLEGTYWEFEGRTYYYIETTGEGWGIGDIPARYENEKAYLYQV
jgi:hypothetical protein